jgi:DNA topoisomerase-1
MVIRKSRRGPFLSCSGFPRCRNAMPMDKIDHLRSLAAAGQIPEPPPADAKRNGRAAKTRTTSRAKGKAASGEKVDVSKLGPPPKGFAWTRTGRPVVETWPEGTLTCPDCGGEMHLRTGRFGPFYSCDKCKAAVNLRGEAKKRAEAEMPAPSRPKPIETGIPCPDCGQPMLLRMGRTGRFLGCSGYPKCKKTMEAPPGLLREVAETSEAQA